MDNLLSLTRAARLVRVSRAALQKKIQCGEMDSHDGMVSVESLLACYPDAQVEDSAELTRVARIKESAFGKRVFEHSLPDAEVLAARITELGRSLARSQEQVRQYNVLLDRLRGKLAEDVERDDSAARETMENLQSWIEHEVEATMLSGPGNPWAVRDGVLRVMTAQVTVLPSRHDFMVEGQDTLLEAAMRSGIPLNYGCSGGNCGLCKARILSGQVKKTRHHDFVIPEVDKEQGCVLLCSNTAVGDVTLEAPVAGSVQDIPFQQISARVKSMDMAADNVVVLHLETPRSQRLRFLAGQRITLRVGLAYTAELSIASCPCDDRNLLFHLRRMHGNLFSDYVFDRLKRNDMVELEGPQGEFILHEKSPRTLCFFAFDDGFAPVKSLVEHAMSLEAATISLQWIGSSRTHVYMPNVGRAWADALDDFRYAEHVAGFDLRALGGGHAGALLKLLEGIVAGTQGMLEGDVYLAGPAATTSVAERFFMDLGLPKTRVFVEEVE